MKIRSVIQIIISIVAIILGGFWFLQGIGILNVCPILCFADCACIEGGSQIWAVVGAGVFTIGILTIIVTMRHK